MAESARQLLEGIARALAEDVAPHVGDRFAQMQCKAAAELLGNLAAELDWAPEPIEQRNRELRELLEALRRAGWPTDAAGEPTDSPALHQARLLDELRSALRWLAERPPETREAVDAMLRDDLERQVAALRRGMFR
jgi:hypothetical protein